MNENRSLMVLDDAALERIACNQMQLVSDELRVLEGERKQVVHNIEKAKTMATPPWFRIDEIRRGSRGSLEGNLRLAHMENAYRWLNDLEMSHREIAFNIGELNQNLMRIKSRVWTERSAYSLIRSEAKAVKFRMPYRVSLAASRAAYRHLAKIYSPHNYDIYSDVICLDRAKAERKFKFIILEVGSAYKFIRDRMKSKA